MWTLLLRLENLSAPEYRVGHSISNLSIIRKIVFNLIKLDTSFGKISFEKKMTKYKVDFTNIENLIFNVLPTISA